MPLLWFKKLQKSGRLGLLSATLSVATALLLHIDLGHESYLPPPGRSDSRIGLDDHFVIGIFGDSWVDSALAEVVAGRLEARLGQRVVCRVSGHPGARTRRLYQTLKAAVNASAAPARHQEAMAADTDYLVIVAGVNDALTHSGTSFYAHHMGCMVKHAEAYGITPVVVELPAFGVREAWPGSGTLWLRSRVYQWLNDGNVPNCVEAYRAAWRASGESGDALIVEHHRAALDYQAARGKYCNPSHLNRDGKEALGLAIADRIVEAEQSKLREPERMRE
jgi:hypothetical protein